MADSLDEIHREMQSRIDSATAQLSHLANHDVLTGLPNRRAFEQAIRDAIAIGRRRGDHHVLCFIDLDRFKIVNDTCGHAAGDELLCRIAALLRGRLREQDVVSRMAATSSRCCCATAGSTTPGESRRAFARRWRISVSLARTGVSALARVSDWSRWPTRCTDLNDIPRRRRPGLL